MKNYCSIPSLFKFSNEDYTFEQCFVNIAALLSFAISFFGFVSNLILGLGSLLIFSNLLASIIFFFCYIILLQKRYHDTAKWVYFISILLFIDFIWFSNSGALGGMPYILMSLFVLSILAWDKKNLKWFIVVFAINLSTVFLIEYYFPLSVIEYHSRSVMYLDLFITLLMSLGAILFIVSASKKYYITEREKAVKSEQLKTAFLANISHEIRTPMNSIIGFSQLLKYSDALQTEDYINQITEQGDILLKLIDNIIIVSQIESDDISIRMTKVKLDNLFINVVDSFDQMIIQQKKGRLKLIYEKEMSDNVEFLVDVSKLKQVLYNIISNAIKYTDDGYVKIWYKVNGDNINIHIKDTGIGISETNKSAIFNKFSKITPENALKHYSGTGLGLFISYSLIKKMKGDINLSSEIGIGSEFVISLPLITDNNLDNAGDKHRRKQLKKSIGRIS